VSRGIQPCGERPTFRVRRWAGVRVDDVFRTDGGADVGSTSLLPFSLTQGLYDGLQAITLDLPVQGTAGDAENPRCLREVSARSL